MAFFRGDAFVKTIAGGIPQNARNFAVRTENLDGSPTNRPWQMNEGDAITLYYREFTTGVPPAAPTGVTVAVYLEDTGTLVRTLHSDGSAPPASGASWTFYATHDGAQNGTPRPGTYRLYIRARNTNTPAYDVDSDTDGDKGGLQSRVKYSSVSISQPPAGGKFAIGPSAAEKVVVTMGHATPLTNLGHERMEVVFVKANVSPTDIDSDEDVDAENLATGQSRTEHIIDAGFPEASQVYDVWVRPKGDSPLSGLAWTSVASNGQPAGWGVVTSTTLPGRIVKEDAFTVDATITFTDQYQYKATRDLALPATTDFQIDEGTVYFWGRLVNGRGEGIQRAAGVAYTIKKPDTTTHATGTLETGSDGWSVTGSQAAVAPDGAWSYELREKVRDEETRTKAIVHHHGNGPRAVEVVFPVWLDPYRVQKVHVRTLYGGAPEVPEGLPVLRLVRRRSDASPGFEVVVDRHMRNREDHTTTVRGTHYLADIQPTKRGVASLEVIAKIRGGTLRALFPTSIGGKLPTHVHNRHDHPQIRYKDLGGVAGGIGDPASQPVYVVEDAATQTADGVRSTFVREAGVPAEMAGDRAARLLALLKAREGKLVAIASLGQAPIQGDTARVLDVGVDLEVQSAEDLGGGRYRIVAGPRESAEARAARLVEQRLAAAERYK